MRNKVFEELPWTQMEIQKDRIMAKGLYLPNAIFSFDDDVKSILSYPDMGLFVLLAGSHAAIPAKEKYLPYIKDGKTTRTIIFQSRNSAARFVLGETGNTNDWKE